MAERRAGRRDRAVAGAIQLAILGAALLVLSPLLASGAWYDSHEGLRYLVRAELFADAVQHGVWYPRFLPDLYYGYGYPLFCFYQPGFFYWVLPFMRLPLATHQALQLALAALLYAGGLGAYLLGRQLAGRLWGLFAALWFLLTPYLYVNLYVRGDLSELAGMLACPWAVFALCRLDDRLARGRPGTAAALGLALACVALISFHPAPSLFLLPLLLGLAAVLAWRRPHARALAQHLGLAVALALALTAPYWLTVLELRPHVGFERLVEEQFRPERNGVAFGRLVANAWGFGGARAGSPGGAMSVQLGAPHLLLALLGGWCGRRRRIVLAASGAYLALVLLMLPVAAPLWERAGILRYVQFPWRLLSVTATLQLVAALGLHGLVEGRRPLAPGWQAAALAAALLGAALWHADQFAIGAALDPEQSSARAPERVGPRADRVAMLGGRSEYLPATARIRPRRPRDRSLPPLRLEGAGRLRPMGEPDPYHLRYVVATPAPASLVIEQVYLPGWCVRINGRRVERRALERALTPEGFMRIELPTLGVRKVEAAYEGPPGWRRRNAVVVVVAALCVALLLRARRRGR